MNQVPVPHDLELQLPLPEGLLKILLVLLFLIHILFVNFMVGGVTLSFIFEIIGLKNKKYDALAREISGTVTVNKSLAIVLGVAPLLAINLAYTTYFYSATSLTGIAWMMVIPAVTIAFLLTYIHKYTWDKLENNKFLHLTFAFMGLILFWTIPLIFLSNVNLMLFPSRWTEVHGFIPAVLLQNVIPRYLHFMLATIAVSSLFAVGWFGRKKFDVNKHLPGFSREEIKYNFYLIAFIATLMQFIAGPLLLFTLPVYGISITVYGFILLGVLAAVLFMFLVWYEIRDNKKTIGRFFWTVILLLTGTVISMAFGRHYYRERAIEPHRQLVETKTQELYWKSEAARTRLRMGISKEPAKSAGQAGFEKNCAVCHAKETVLVGPSLNEIFELYEDYPEGIVEWSKAPEVKRGGPVMPSFAHLGDEELLEIGKYMLKAAAE
ncbi:cytochrome c [candidate division KSB1 bacterium]|nr:cytochrome c [candidate division KSB1 bacterium]